MNTANTLTLLRFLLSFIIFAVLSYSETKSRWVYQLCDLLFIIASLTDLLDGFVARYNNEITQFGTIMDTVADKVLTDGVLICLSVDKLLSPMIAILVVSRDFLIIAVKILPAQSDKATSPSNLGRWKAAFLMLGIILLLSGSDNTICCRVGYILLYVGSILSLYTGLDYCRKSTLFSENC